MKTSDALSTSHEAERPRRDVLYVFVFFLCAYWLTNCGFDRSEAVHHYKVAKHLVETGHLGFDHPVEGIFTVAPNGWTYGSHEFGNALLLIPMAAFNFGVETLSGGMGVSTERLRRLEQCAISFQAGIYAALTLMFLYLLLTREWRQTARVAFLACQILGFATFYWEYSRSLFDGVLCGLLVIAALWCLVRYRATGCLIHVGAAFSLLGLAVDTRLSMAIPTLVGISFVVLARPGRRWGALLVAVAALAPFAAWQMWYNHLRTGSLLLSPVQTLQYADNNALDGDIVTGLAGLLVSPGKGLFIYAPVLLLSPIAFPRFWRRDRAVAAFVLANGVLWLLLHAKLRSWYGAWGWGPRHLITMLPIFAIPGLVCLEEFWARPWSRGLVVATVAAGFILAAASVIGNYHYRLELALHEERIDDATFVWGWRNQAVDMLLGAENNLFVLAGANGPTNIPHASELNNYASNRINIWWFTLPHAGVPPLAVIIGCVPLLVGLLWTAHQLLKRSTESNAK